MLGDFFRLLAGRPKGSPLPELDARRAAGALLVRLARSDAHYAFEEIAEIDRVLAARHGLGPVEAMKLRADCERIAAAAPDTDAFAALVREAVDYDARHGLVETLWHLAHADRRLAPEEVAALAEIGRGLGVNPDDLAALAARHGG